MNERQLAICDEEQKAIEIIQNEEPESKETGTQSEKLADVAIEQCSFFKTLDHIAFAVIDKGDHQETWAVKSHDFDLWLRLEAFKATGKVPGAQAIRDTKRLLEGQALIDSPTQQAHIRFAQHEEGIYVDLANPNWEQIRVTRDGYRIVSSKESPVRFIRTPAMLSLPYPDPGDSLSTLRNFLNLEHEGDLVLIVSWLIGAMRENGPFPILMLQGEQGTAKSFTAKLLCSLIDPSALESRGLPKSERDLAISASKSWLLSFDNLSHLEQWLSDALCRVATGGGLANRTLYTDDSETIFRFKRPQIMNGISDIATRHDLVDRSLIINLPVIPEERRRSERQIWESWMKVRPQILAALLIAVSTALRNIGQVKLERSPRMADFAEWVTAAESSLPWEEGTFLKEYALNREYLVDVGLESDEVGSSVMQLMKARNVWSGTPTDLLKKLNRIVSKSIQRRKYWPKRPNTLSNRLMQVAPVLRKKGIDVERSKSGKRKTTITKIQKTKGLTGLIVQEPKSIRESGGRIEKDHVGIMDHYFAPIKDKPVLMRVDDQGDAISGKDSHLEANASAEAKAWRG